jgi:hypothetical protein
LIIDEGWSCRYPILGFILLSLCLVSVVAALISQLPSHNPYSCDTRDGVYLAILENADDWQKTFKESRTQYVPIHAIRFEVLGVTRGYDVRPDNINDIDLLYVSTHFGWPQNLWGSRGYLYVFDHSALDWWEHNFAVQHLSGPVYCYSK